MSTRIRDSLIMGIGQLRHEPIAKRVRAVLEGSIVVDSTRVVLLWEPRRAVPSYAVPVGDVYGELVTTPPPLAADTDEADLPMPDLSRGPVLDPSVPFVVHTADGETLDVRTHGQTRPGAGFRLTDPDLAGYVVLDFAAFDGWYEEDEPNVGHPRDPFHRIDVLSSSRHVRLELDSEVVADSSRPTLLFEAMLPTAVLPATRGRTSPADPERETDLLRLQGAGVVLVGRNRRSPCPRPRLDLRAAAA